MVQILDFMWRTRDDKILYDSIMNCLVSGKSEEITILNRYRLNFRYEEGFVYIDRVLADDVKIIPCKMPYQTLTNLLNGDYEHLDGLEWG